MTAPEEKAQWVKIMGELRERFTVSYIAEEIGVSDRQVCNWQAGADVPKGMNAVRLHAFHAKHRTVVHEP